MRTICFRLLPILVLSALLPAIPNANAGAADVPPAVTKPAATYPQIVRLSYVEGDVRVSRGKEGSKADEKESGEETGWEQAAANLPLETGFSLATGKGRAEIEFEDASTVYLGENSVLVFNQLSTTNGVPWTNLAVLTGVATLNVRPMVTGEWFILNTPADNISLRYPQRAYLRVNSYVDAIGLTSQSDLTFKVPAWGQGHELPKGQTMMFHDGLRVNPVTKPDPAASAEWDKWVEARVQARDAAMAAAMKESGLTAPVPGLAEMNGQGRFFSCEPYGTCWEPAKGWDGGATESEVAMVAAQPGVTGAAKPGVAAAARSGDDDISAQVALVDRPQVSVSSAAGVPPELLGQKSAQAYLAAHPGAMLRTDEDVLFFPCLPEDVRYLIAMDPVTGKEKIIGSELFAGFTYPIGYSRGRGYRGFGAFPSLWGYPYLSAYPWEWAVCHTGGWIRREHRYVWVAGLKRHHHPPIRWVKSGRSVGFVPLHPRDVAGKPPINLKEGMFVMKGDKGEKGAQLERVDVDTGRPVKLLDAAPKEFRKPEIVALKRAQVPHAEAHAATGMFMASAPRTEVPKPLAMPITFDRKSQSFAVERQEMQGGRAATVSERLGGGGPTAQARGGEGSAGGSSAARSFANNSSSNQGSYSRPSTPAPSYSGGGDAAAYHPSAPSPPSIPSAPSPTSAPGGGPSTAAASRSH